MPLVVYFDTSAIVAWASGRDEHHDRATEEFARLTGERREFILTTDVFDEAVTLMLGRRGHRAAASLGDSLRTGVSFRLVEVGSSLRDDAWLLFKRHADHPLSFTDCTSLIAMRRLGIREAFSFDSDFERAGVVRLPR